MTGGSYGGSVAVDDMTDMGGSVVTIEDVDKSGYGIKEDPEGYTWTDEMFEPVGEMSVEDVTEVKEEAMKMVLKEYCKEHEGKFFTVYEEIFRVKE